MDAAPPPNSDMPAPPPGYVPDARSQAVRADTLLDALKAALAVPGEHRLFRSGKLAGLFNSRFGQLRMRHCSRFKMVCSKACGRRQRERLSRSGCGRLPRLLSTSTRTILHGPCCGNCEPYWPRPVPVCPPGSMTRGRTWRHLPSDSKRDGVDLKRLDDLTLRVEAALRRAETTSRWSERHNFASGAVGGGGAGISGSPSRPRARRRECPLPELFDAVQRKARDANAPRIPGRHPPITRHTGRSTHEQWRIFE